MSGGHFDYAQYRLSNIADLIEQAIDDNNLEWRNYSEETLDRFREAIRYLNIAETYAHRIDWLLSGDESEESFHERLNEQLQLFIVEKPEKQIDWVEQERVNILNMTIEEMAHRLRNNK